MASHHASHTTPPPNNPPSSKPSSAQPHPLDSAFMGHPKPLFSLCIVELWERFSFYGIRPLLVLFMSALVIHGGLGLEIEQASAIVGIFGGCLYLATLPGGWLADNVLGQKNAIFLGAIIIALGHLSIALSYFATPFFFLGLGLIVCGTGLFKTCASVMVGMLYKDEDVRRDSGFTMFYMGINIGAFFAPLLCGFFQQEYGWHVGFGAGGVGMLIALWIFYKKTLPDFNEFQQKVGLAKGWDTPPRPPHLMKILCLSGVVIIALGVLFSMIDIDALTLSKRMAFIILVLAGIYFIYLFFGAGLQAHERKNLLVFIVLFFTSAVFWATFEQMPTSFNLFALDFTQRIIFGFEIPAAWFQSLNALFVIIFAPLISIAWIALAKRGHDIHPIIKFALGVGFACAGFFIMVCAAYVVLEGGGKANMLFLVGSFFLLTIGELCLSPVGLSLMTKIAPNVIKSQVMGLWFVSLALGNVVAGLIGGGVRVDNLSALPSVFGQCMWVLLGVCVAVLLLSKPIISLLKEKA